MGVPNKQIGWSQEANLLHEVSKQLEKLKGAIQSIENTPVPVPSVPGVWTQAAYDATYTEAQARYVRPVDWLPMPAMVNGDKKVAILHRVDNVDGNFVAFTIAGNYTVNWGDGTPIENINSGIPAQHKYIWNNVSASTLTSDGFRQAMIEITPQSGQDLTSLNFGVKHNQTGIITYTTGFLDMKIASQQCNSLTLGSTGVVLMKELVNFEWVGSHSLTTYSFLFMNCHAMQKCAMGDFPNSVTSTANMFDSCYSLITTNLFNTALVTTAATMFNNCYSLLTTPLYNFVSLGIATSMFQGCSSLVTLPMLNFSNVTNAVTMFFQCYALNSVPPYNFSKVTNANNLFNACSSLRFAPAFDFTLLTNGSSMFLGCNALETTGSFIFNSLTTTASMFFGCLTLKTVALFNTSKVTDFGTMFEGCRALVSVPLFSLSSASSTTRMFFNCFSLRTVPAFVTNVINNLTSCGEMFSSCYNLKSVPLFNTSAVSTNISNMFNNCYSLAVIPAYNFSNAPTIGILAGSSTLLSSINCTGMKVTVTLTNLLLSNTALETVFANLASNVITQSVTITGNWGAQGIYAAVPKASVTTTALSPVCAVADTTSLAIGQEVIGLVSSTAVTTQGVANTLTATSHGFSNGKQIFFSVVTTTTGIILKTPYYVVNATANTFQISLTPGVAGPVVDFTTDGSATVAYSNTITAINPGVSFTVEIAARTSTTGAVTARLLSTAQALGKGWTVTG